MADPSRLGGDPATYGRYYFCVGLPDEKQAYVHADEVRVEPSGALVAVHHAKDDPPRTHLHVAVAPGQWVHVYAASLIGGTPVAVEYWSGEIAPNRRS
jgi:hypothetical protein